MEIKGLSVKSVSTFIQKKFPSRFQEWLNILPESSKSIFSGFIKVNEWYPIQSGLTIPLHKTGELFYNGDWKKAVWEMGRFSAEEALTGIYKIYVKLGSPRHIIDRASRVMAAYFSNCEIKLVPGSKTQITMQILKFDEPDESIEYNIAGWIERALEISGVKNIKVEIPKSLARKDAYTAFEISYE